MSNPKFVRTVEELRVAAEGEIRAALSEFASSPEGSTTLGQWVTALAEFIVAGEKEREALEARVAQLEARVAQLEARLDGQGKA